MGLFWRLLAAHFLVDFTLQTRWFIRYKDKASAIALHSALFVVASIFFVYPMLWNSIEIFVSIFSLGVLHFFVDFVKSKIAKKQGTNIYLFLADQIIHIFAILFVSMWLFYMEYPLIDKYFPAIALSIFAIWGIPIIIFLVKDRLAGNLTVPQNFLFEENSKTLSMLERASIFVSVFLGGWYWLCLAIVAIIRSYLLFNKKDKSFPIWGWGFSGLLALAIRFVRI